MADETPPGGHGETQQFKNFGDVLRRLGQNPMKYIRDLERDRAAIDNALLNPFRFVEERIAQKKLDPFGEYAKIKQELAERVKRGEITPLEENLLRFTEGFTLVESEVVRREQHILTAEARFKANAEKAYEDQMRNARETIASLEARAKELDEICGQQAAAEKQHQENLAVAQQKIAGLETRVKALGASAALQQSAMADAVQEKQELRGQYACARLSTLASLFDAYARLNPAAGKSHDDEGGVAPSLNTEYVNFLKRCGEQLGKETKDAVIAWVGNPDRSTQPVEESLQNLVLADTDKVDAFVHAETLRLSSYVLQGFVGMQLLQDEKITEHKATAERHRKEMARQFADARRDKVRHYLRWRAERAALQKNIADLAESGKQAGDAYSKLDALYQGVLKEQGSVSAKYAQLEADYKKVIEDKDTLDVLLGTVVNQAEDEKKRFATQHTSLEKQVADKDKELERLRDAYKRRVAASEERERLATEAAKQYIKSREDELNAEIIETRRRQGALAVREQELVALRAQLEESDGRRKATFGYLARVLAGKHKEYEAGIAERRKAEVLALLQMKVADARVGIASKMLEQAGLLPDPQSSYDGAL
jgi:hypothetical protein